MQAILYKKVAGGRNSFAGGTGVGVDSKHATSMKSAEV
jgi:hypothetical protein